jgi:hypothetical protein
MKKMKATKPSVDEPLQQEPLDAFTDQAQSSLRAFPKPDKRERAVRADERDEVARALKLALKSSPALKPQLERVTKALKQAEQHDAELGARIAKSVEAGLAELAELSKRHSRR